MKTTDNKHLEYIFKEVADQFNISIEDVRQMFHIEMKLLHATITDGSNTGFRMKYLGLFGVKRARLLFDKNYFPIKERREQFNIVTNTKLRTIINERRREKRANK
jgi:hypothetical protein